MINEFKTELTAFMGHNFYIGEAPEDAVYPYRVAVFNGSFDDEVAEVFSLEIDYWDSGKSTTAIYSMAERDAGNGWPKNPSGLNKKRFTMSTGAVVLSKDSTTELADPDKNLRRVRVSYYVRAYYKED